MPVLTLLFAVLAALAAVSGSTITAYDVASAAPPAVAQGSDPLDLQIWVSPYASSPGEGVVLNVVLTNNGGEAITPELTIALPENVAVDIQNLPIATGYNLQTGNVIWQPHLPSAGGSELLELPMTVNVADLSNPEQSVTVHLRDGRSERTVAASFWVGVLPSAAVSFHPPQVAVGQPVGLRAELSGPGPISQSWHLGDGRTLEVIDPEVVYPAAGTYQVTLQMSNPLGSAVASGLLTVVPQPIARISADDMSPGVNQPVAFVNQGGGEPPLIHEWQFGDGSISSEANPVHQFASPGEYQVRLVIRNDFGQSEAFLSLTVGQGPIADAIVTEVIDAGQLVVGQAFTDDSVTEIRWDMGDGHQYEGAEINHVYWSAGDYPVVMTASNDHGATRVTRWVQVRPGRLFLFLPVIHAGLEPNLEGTFTRSEETLPAAGAPELVNVVELEHLPLLDQLPAAEQLLAYINEARRLSGLAPVSYVHELSVAAQEHADDMAALGYTGHVGSDGSSPALRVQISGYPGGYGGEATAWGMNEAIEPVQFWLSSPPHSAILLNPAATEVGVGFSENYSAPNIWYWTAVFASPDLPVIRVPVPTPTVTGTVTDTVPAPPAIPQIQLLGPPRDSEFSLSPGSNRLIFTWSWPLPLEPGERFAIYLNAGSRVFQVGAVREPSAGNQYQFSVAVADVPVSPGQHEWQVKLETSGQRTASMESSSWPLKFVDTPESLDD